MTLRKPFWTRKESISLRQDNRPISMSWQLLMLRMAISKRQLKRSQRAIDLLPVREQASMDDFRSRFDLYAQGLPFLMDP